MNLLEIQLLLDFGLVVLIWIVQLIVYPSFKYYNIDNLVNWHRVYAFRIGMIVMPLMLGQIMISFIRVLGPYSLLNIFHLLLVILVWFSTFFQFVPMHNQISNNKNNDGVIVKLIKNNWLRTFIWTCIFACAFFQSLK